jgi:fucose 4-O-acetylase-like acetyltransferase
MGPSLVIHDLGIRQLRLAYLTFDRRQNPGQIFAGDKFRRLAYPYFVWSIITLMFKAALGGVTNHPEDLADFRLIFCQPIDQF